MREKQITYSGQSKTLAEWAEYLGINYPIFCYHVRKHGPSKAIEKVINQTAGITNPETRETRSIAEWARLLGMNQSSFKHRLSSWGIHDPRTFLDKDEILGYQDGAKSENLRIQIAQRNNQRLCRHPESGIEKLACDWAKHYKVPLIEFYQAMQKYGRNSRELYQHFEARKVA